MKSLLIDLETTDLVQPLACDIQFQPHIIEIGAMVVNDKLKVIKEFETFVKPPIPIPYFITNHTGISDIHVKNAPEFWQVVKKLKKIFKGTDIFVSHNVGFDKTVLEIELRRCKKLKKFPIPGKSFCTAEQSIHFKGHRLSLEQLYEEITGKSKKTKHRALEDCKDLLQIYRGLLK